ncbi:hypothetical protein EV182_007354, partial [Spiromyces aspiralis]
MVLGIHKSSASSAPQNSRTLETAASVPGSELGGTIVSTLQHMDAGDNPRALHHSGRRVSADVAGEGRISETISFILGTLKGHPHEEISRAVNDVLGYLNMEAERRYRQSERHDRILAEMLRTLVGLQKQAPDANTESAEASKLGISPTQAQHATFTRPKALHGEFSDEYGDYGGDDAEDIDVGSEDDDNTNTTPHGNAMAAAAAVAAVMNSAGASSPA